MKVGLFGGTFDPVHAGHVEPVEEARRILGLERVYFLPTAVPPHKQGHRLAPALARLVMVELALLGREGLYVSGHELTLGRPAYTIDTLEHFRRAWPQAEIHLILGRDAFVQLPTWRRWREIPELATLVVLRRQAGPHRDAPLSPELTDLGTAVQWVDNTPQPFSASSIRDALRQGQEPLSGALEEKVLDYIRKYRLYHERDPGRDL